jgi:sulfur carrier protein
MQLTINGESRQTPSGNVLELLSSLNIDPQRVAVELNQEILPKADYGTTQLHEGDSLEIVQFVGGG